MTDRLFGSLPDLAQAGFALSRQTSTQVDFSVHHVADRQGYMLRVLRDGLADPPADEKDPDAVRAPRFVEMLSSAANGIGVIIGTSTRTTAGSAAGDTPATLRFPELLRPARNLFSGLATPNPTFLYESLETFEVLIAMERAENSRITIGRALELRDLLYEVTSLAANTVRAPLLSVQSPVQVPVTVRWSRQDVRDRPEGVPPQSSSLGVRFTIPLTRPDARTRMTISTRLARYCGERGYGLWLTDHRAGRRAGNWFQILPLEPAVVEENAGDPTDVEVAVPVTFVGPARIGSAYAIMNYLSQYRGIGIAACTISSLGDLAFVHLQLVLGGLPPDALPSLRERLESLASGSPSGTSLDQLLLWLGVEREDVATGALSARARDYQTLIGSSFTVVPRTGARRMAVWFAWRAERSHDALARPIEALCAAAAAIGLDPVARSLKKPPLEGSPNIEYLVCRQMNGMIRGKGKLSLPKDVVDKKFGGRGVEAAASRMCSMWEEAWKIELDQCESISVSESTVAWREWWLGHWTSSL